MSAIERRLIEYGNRFDRQLDEAREWFEQPRFDGIIRLYSPGMSQNSGDPSGPSTLWRGMPQRLSMRA